MVCVRVCAPLMKGFEAKSFIKVVSKDCSEDCFPLLKQGNLCLCQVNTAMLCRELIIVDSGVRAVPALLLALPLLVYVA